MNTNFSPDGLIVPAHAKSKFRLAALAALATCTACTALLAPTGSASAQVLDDPDGDPDFNVAKSSWGSGLLYISDIVVQSESSDPLLNEKIDLIDDDETLTSTLPGGKSVFLIRLKESSIVNSFRFYNFNAGGSLKAYAQGTASKAGDSSPWIPVSHTLTYHSSGPVTLWFDQEISASVIRVVFDTSKEGEISGFGVAGSFFAGVSPKQTQLVRQTQATDNQVLANVLSPYSGARVIATSGGMAPSSKAMIDDLVETSHVFSETNAEPLALIDLGEPREIERVTALINSPEPVQMELYFLDDLGKIEGMKQQPIALNKLMEHSPLLALNSGDSWISAAAQSAGSGMINITVPHSFFENHTPNVVAKFKPGSRRARANVGGSSFSQYVLVRWIYSNGLPAEFGGLVVNELNFLGRYVWDYEHDPEAPAEGPENDLTLTSTSTNPGSDPPKIPPVSP